MRVSPDVYLAFGVDAQAIRPRKLYLPWEVGKPPDWVLEIGSASTGREDVGRKRDLYAHIGVPEYWRFDPSKESEYHGQKLAGDRLVGGEYRPIELTTAPDGLLKGYSDLLKLSLCWDDGWPRFYDPATETYLTNWRQERAARRAERDTYEARAAVEQAGRLAEQAARRVAENRAASEQAAREAAEARIRQLEAELRRRPSGPIALPGMIGPTPIREDRRRGTSPPHSAVPMCLRRDASRSCRARSPGSPPHNRPSGCCRRPAVPS